MTEQLKYRFATPEDVTIINEYIWKLAKYEKLEHVCFSTPERLEETLFDKQYAEVILYEVDGESIGFSLFFTTYSTFEAKGCMYLEDLYIDEVHRNKGYGKQIFNILAHICVERDYARMEWSCLDWNEPSLAFYKGLGASELNAWIKLRLEAEEIKALAKS